MDRDELAETIFEAMNNERIESRQMGEQFWEDLPKDHQAKYLRVADGIITCWKTATPTYTFEGVE